MVAGILAGAFIGFIAGVLKATRGVHEVITTIMLNYIAAGVTWWLVLGPCAGRDVEDERHPEDGDHPGGGQGGRRGPIPIGFLIAMLAGPAGGC